MGSRNRNALDNLLLDVDDFKEINLNEIEGIIECNDIEGLDTTEKYKAIKLKTNEYIFDFGSLTLPFIAEYRGDKVLTIDVIQGNSTIQVRSSVLGVPTLFDKSVLMAIQKLFVQQRAIGGKLMLNRKDPTKYERTMNPISLTDIFRAMGYSGYPSFMQALKISESIERLGETTYNLSENRIIDHENERYIMKAKENIKLLNYKKIELTKAELEKRKKHASRKGKNKDAAIMYRQAKEKIIDGRIQLILSEEVYLALACDQLVYYNDPQVLSIKNTLARHIYVLVYKWAGSAKEIKVSINKILVHIPMKVGKSEYNQKATIKKAIKILSEENHCQIVFLKNDVVHFNFKKKTKIEQSHGNDYMKDKFNTIQELNQGYTELGFDDGFIFTQDLSKIAYYQALLRYVTLRNKYGGIDKPKEYTQKFIEEGLPVDKKYYN